MNPDHEEIIRHEFFDIGYCHQRGGTWTFTVPPDAGDCALYIYAGIYGATSGVGLAFLDVALSMLDDAASGAAR